MFKLFEEAKKYCAEAKKINTIPHPAEFAAYFDL